MMVDSTGTRVNLPYVFRHTPMYPKKGGQVGNVYTGAGFGRVENAYALTKYGEQLLRKFNRKSTEKFHNISGYSVNRIKNLILHKHPVLFYGYSSYQKYGDLNRNHCKVISGYRHGYFRVYDPLYYNKHQVAGEGGHNMNFDRGAISWISLKHFTYEYARKGGSNRKSAITVY